MHPPVTNQPRRVTLNLRCNYRTRAGWSRALRIWVVLRGRKAGTANSLLSYALHCAMERLAHQQGKNWADVQRRAGLDPDPPKAKPIPPRHSPDVTTHGP